MLISKLKIAMFVAMGLSLLTFGATMNMGTAQENQGKAAKKAMIVEVDLNKLPPDLA